MSNGSCRPHTDSGALAGRAARLTAPREQRAPAADGPARRWQVLPLAARTPRALAQRTQQLIRELRDQPGASLAELAHALQADPAPLEQRRALVARDRADALAVLQGADPQRLLGGTAARPPRPLALLFPGPGSQHPGMAAELYASEPVFRWWVDRCGALLAPHLGLDLGRLLYADQPPTTDEERAARARGAGLRPRSSALRPGLDESWLAQPALFVVEYALAQLWMSWGLQPAALLGHSLGEYVAATLAGVFTLEDALALVAERGRLVQSLPAGAMLTVALPEAELLPLLAPDLDLAAVNGPRSCVIAGPAESVAALGVLLQGRGVQCRRLHTAHAFHSQMMAPILEAFAARVARAARRAPRLPVISSLSGAWLSPAQAADPRYWAAQLRQTVRFAEGVATLLRDRPRTLLEVGPGIALSTCARACAPAATTLASLGHPTDDRPADLHALAALGRLWVSGCDVDWKRFQGREPLLRERER